MSSYHPVMISMNKNTDFMGDSWGLDRIYSPEVGIDSNLSAVLEALGGLFKVHGSSFGQPA
jgi:hypothetical protein